MDDKVVVVVAGTARMLMRMLAGQPAGRQQPMHAQQVLVQDARRPAQQTQGKPRLRDALTGEVLIDADGRRTPACGTRFLRVPAPLTDEDPRTLPTRLHTQRDVKDGILGAKAWSRDFRRYLEQTYWREERQDRREWFTRAYAVDQVKRRFQDRYPDRPEYAELAANAALWALRDPDAAPDICEDLGKTRGWLEHQIDLAYRFSGYSRRDARE